MDEIIDPRILDNKVENLSILKKIKFFFQKKKYKQIKYIDLAGTVILVAGSYHKTFGFTEDDFLIEQIENENAIGYGLFKSIEQMVDIKIGKYDFNRYYYWNFYFTNENAYNMAVQFMKTKNIESKEAYFKEKLY